MKKYLFISLLALGLTACSDKKSDQPVNPVIPPVTDQYALSFTPDAPAFSRDRKPLQDTYDIFKVWSFKTTSSSKTETVMPGYQVKWLNASDGWQYDGTTYTSHTELKDQFLKYWDASAHEYNFLGIAQRYAADQSEVVLPEGVTIETGPDGFIIRDLKGHTSEPKELIMAHQRRYVPYGSQTLKDVDVLIGMPNIQQPQNLYDKVPMVFHHMISQVEFYIYNTGTKSANISKVELNLNQPMAYAGDWENGSLTPTSENKKMLDKLYSPSSLELKPAADLTRPKADATRLNTYYELPQSLGNKVTVAVATDDAGILTKSFDLPDNLWLPDHYYAYYIHIEAGESQVIPILVDLEVVDFTPGWALDDEQTNW